jgi:hypothetical protein
MNRTGLNRTAAERALRRLEAAGLADPSTGSFSWRTDAGTLTPTREDDQ